MKTETLTLIAPFIQRFTHVGSRVTCDPAPQHTDDDILVLVDLPKTVNCPDYEVPLYLLKDALLSADWVLGGSAIDERLADGRLTAYGRFNSWTKGEENLIITADPEFHQRFIVATQLARALNVLDKQVRIQLFQAVLYGNGDTLTGLEHTRIGPVPKSPFDLPPAAQAPKPSALDDLI